MQSSSVTPTTPRARRGVWLAVLLALAGCTTAGGSPPASGTMWAFFTDADLVLGPGAIIYTSSQISCEIERRGRAEFTLPCVQVAVSPGPGYYAVSLPSNLDVARPAGATFGTLDQEHCERLRTALFRTYNAMGDCEPVAIKRIP